MLLTEVRAVLDALDEAGITHWLAGGWGVDALVGRETRAHRDLDLLVVADRLEECVGLLARRGYVVETDWLPVRVELVAPGVGWVDLHPVEVEVTGTAVQQGPDETTYRYPAACRVTGSLRGRPVPCLSAERQLEAHTGYPPRPQDTHDLALLGPLVGVPRGAGG